MGTFEVILLYTLTFAGCVLCFGFPYVLGYLSLIRHCLSRLIQITILADKQYKL